MFVAVLFTLPVKPSVYALIKESMRLFHSLQLVIYSHLSVLDLQLLAIGTCCQQQSCNLVVMSPILEQWVTANILLEAT